MRYCVVYTDGGCQSTATCTHPVAIGAGIVAICDGHREEWAVPLGNGTSQQAELLAIKAALTLLTDRKQLSVLIITDSQYACNALTNASRNLKKNLKIIRSLQSLIRQFGAVRFQWCRGHATVEENIRADFLASIACGRKSCPEIAVLPLAEFG